MSPEENMMFAAGVNYAQQQNQNGQNTLLQAQLQQQQIAHNTQVANRLRAKMEAEQEQYEQEMAQWKKETEESQDKTDRMMADGGIAPYLPRKHNRVLAAQNEAKMLSQEVSQDRANVTLKERKIASSINPDTQFDVPSLRLPKFSRYEYENFVDNLDHGKLESVAQTGFYLSRDLNKSMPFARLAKQDPDVYKELNAQAIKKTQADLKRDRDNFNKELDMPACFANLKPDARKMVNDVEHMKISKTTSASVLALAVSELRYKAFLNSAIDPDNHAIIGYDVPMLYRSYRVQEALSHLYPDTWQQSAIDADNRLVKEKGSKMVTTAKLISHDYLTYLDRYNHNGQMKPCENYNQLVASYPQRGLLAQYPLKLDKYRDSRHKYIQASKEYSKLETVAPEKEKLWNDLTDYFATRAEEQVAKADYDKNLAHHNLIITPESDYKDFDQQWAIAHHGTQDDWWKFHPETSPEYQKQFKHKHSLGDLFNHLIGNEPGNNNDKQNQIEM